MEVGSILCLCLTPQPSSSWGGGEGEEELPLEAPLTCSSGPLHLHLPVLTICLTSILCPCYASALMACPPSTQQLSQLRNQKNGEH